MKKHFLVLASFACLSSITWAQTDTISSERNLQDVVISAIQAKQSTPVTFTTLDKKRIQQLYYGADMPTLLQVTPSVNAYSDNGTGIGYSFFRLRGMDQTRINTTINGIPVNDPENQGVFFNNFADLASSAEQIQAQRGIGTSTNGTSAFGGSINIQTRHLSAKPSAQVSLGMGSFGSSRLTAEVQTGLIDKHWMFYGRIGQVKTNGFRQNSGAQVQSYHFSLGYVKNRSVLKFNFFGGNAQSQLAYLGLDKLTFNQNPVANTFTHGESDAFNQYFNQIQYSYDLGRGQTLSASAYLVNGAAPKFQFLAEGWYTFDALNMANTTYYVNAPGDTIFSPGNVMTSYRLKQQFMGAFANYQLTRGKLDLVAGIHVNQFQADHFMEVNWANTIPAAFKQNHQVYFNTGFKNELSVFAKVNYAFTNRLSVFSDVQVRQTSFTYKGKDMEFRKEYGKVEDMQWQFVNPRAGARFGLNRYVSLYAMAGMSMREPTRFDYLQDDFAPRDIKQNEIKPEQVVNVEFGTELSGFVNGKINVYAMEFQNQIVGTGAVNNFGYNITGNVGRSYRRGVEIDLRKQVTSFLTIWMSSALSSNKIEQFTQTYTDEINSTPITQTYSNTNLAFSPNQIHNIGLESAVWKKRINAGLSFRHVGMQYLDNTSNKDLSLPSFNVLDFQLGLNPSSFRIKGLPQISLRVNNILDAKFAPSGSLGGFNTISSEGIRGQFPLFLPNAGVNYFCTATWIF
jgi:iron complex outermembrane receptor protein